MIEKKFLEKWEKILATESIAFESSIDDRCYTVKAHLEIYVTDHGQKNQLIRKVVELEIKVNEDENGEAKNWRAEIRGGTLFMDNVDPDMAINYFLCEKKLHSRPVVQALSKEKNFYQYYLKVAKRLWSLLPIVVVYVRRLMSGISRFQKKFQILISDNTVRTVK